MLNIDVTKIREVRSQLTNPLVLAEYETATRTIENYFNDVNNYTEAELLVTVTLKYPFNQKRVEKEVEASGLIYSHSKDGSLYNFDIILKDDVSTPSITLLEDAPVTTTLENKISTPPQSITLEQRVPVEQQFKPEFDPIFDQLQTKKEPVVETVIQKVESASAGFIFPEDNLMFKDSPF